MSSSMPLIASNIRPVNSSALAAISHEVGRSSATTRMCFAWSSALGFSQSPRQPVDLFDKQDIAIMGICEQPKENRARQLGAGLVLFVPGNDLEATLRRKDLDLVLSPAGI